MMFAGGGRCAEYADDAQSIGACTGFCRHCRVSDRMLPVAGAAVTLRMEAVHGERANSTTTTTDSTGTF